MYLDGNQGALMNQIAQQRKLLNISQAELAGKLDSGPSRISNFEASIRKPNLKIGRASCRERVCLYV